MKRVFAFLIVLALFVSSVALSQVLPEEGRNDQGQTFFRVHNRTSSWIVCFYRDAYNYQPFRVAPMTTSQWYPTWGVFYWECSYM